MLKEALSQAKQDLKTIENDFKKELSKFRTGRASVSVLDGVMVSYYGTPTPVNQLATLSVPEANLIVIQPWDQKSTPDVEKAIRDANLGLNPISDGKLIRLPIPPLDQERRRELIRKLRMYTEERKTAIRNIRREYRDLAKGLQDDKEISEDEEKRFYDNLQQVVDDGVTALDSLMKEKEAFILEE